MSAESMNRIRDLAAECERAARFIRSYDGKPDELRAWAARIESGVAPDAVCTPAVVLERAAAEARDYIAAHAAKVTQ